MPATIDDDDRYWGLKARRRVARIQPTFRMIATTIGRFRTCSLPKCRRAKRCLGCHGPDVLGTSYFYQYPPCIADMEAKSALVRGFRDFNAKQDAAMRARGVDVEAWKKSLYDQPDPFDDPA
jgi:hypothetical protein